MLKPSLSKLEILLDKKTAHLIALEEKLRGSTNSLSHASFKGKITRCKWDIKIIEARIEEMYPSG